MGNVSWLLSGLAGPGIWVAAAEACSTCGHVDARSPLLWLVIGFLGQGIFTARFLAQWVASERQRDSVVPVVFWWLSMAGGLTLLCYAIHREDPVIIVGQSMGVFIYVRNLMLLAKGRKRAAKRAAAEAARTASVVPSVPRPHLPGAGEHRPAAEQPAEVPAGTHCHPAHREGP